MSNPQSGHGWTGLARAGVALLALAAVGGCSGMEPSSAELDGVWSRLRSASPPPSRDRLGSAERSASLGSVAATPEAVTAPPPKALSDLLPEKWTPIDLSTVLRLADSDNFRVGIAAQLVEEARAGELRSIAAFLPTFVPGYQHFTTEGRNQNRRGEVFDSAYQANRFWTRAELQLNPARAFADTLSARYARSAADAAATQVANDVGLEAALTYHDLTRTVLVVGAAEELRTQTQELVRVTQERVNRGVGLEVDLARARARDAEAAQFLAESVTNFRLTSIRLARTLQLATEATLYPAEPSLSPIVLLNPDTALADLLAAAQANHPTLLEQALAVLAAERTADAALLEGVTPRFLLQANLGGFGGDFSTIGTFQDYSAGVFFNVEGLGLGTTARVRAGHARLRQAELRAEDVRLRLLAEVAAAREQSRLQRGLIATTETQLLAAQESFRLAEQRLKAGTGLLLDVLDAQGLLLRARLARVSAITEFNKAQHRLLNAVGSPQRTE